MFIDVLNHPAFDKFDVSSLYTGRRVHFHRYHRHHHHHHHHHHHRHVNFFVISNENLGLNHPVSFVSGVMAGSPCPIEVMKQVMTKLHMPQVTVS